MFFFNLFVCFFYCFDKISMHPHFRGKVQYSDLCFVCGGFFRETVFLSLPLFVSVSVVRKVIFILQVCRISNPRAFSPQQAFVIGGMTTEIALKKLTVRVLINLSK